MNEYELAKKLLEEQKLNQEKSEAMYNAVFSCETLGQMFKIWRLINGLTQKQLADNLHTKRQHVQKWEYNICKPTVNRLKQLSMLLAKKDISAKIIRRYYV